MRKSPFTEEQIIQILKRAEGRMSVADICRQNSISDTTFYKWKSKYGGLEVSEARRLKLLEQKNARLKRLMAEQALGNFMLIRGADGQFCADKKEKLVNFLRIRVAGVKFVDKTFDRLPPETGV